MFIIANLFKNNKYNLYFKRTLFEYEPIYDNEELCFEYIPLINEKKIDYKDLPTFNKNFIENIFLSDGTTVTYGQHPYHEGAPDFHTNPHYYVDIPGKHHIKGLCMVMIYLF